LCGVNYFFGRQIYLSPRKIIRDRANMPPGKLADAELHFTGGELDGLKLIGFGIWERRIPNRELQRNGFGTYHLSVSLPARSYQVGSERRSFLLLRAIEDTAAQDRLREFVLQAYLAAAGEPEREEQAST
jgi:hypothetical protein